MVYGSDAVRAQSLRTLHNGLLKTLSGSSRQRHLQRRMRDGGDRRGGGGGGGGGDGGGGGGGGGSRSPSNDLPPFNLDGLPNEGGDSNRGLFLVGDVRGNEQIGLISMHTLFVREHNRLARKIRDRFNDASDEEIYQLARKIVGAEIQKIVYDEYLPALMGPMAPRLSEYRGYDANADASLATEFSGAAYRFGHSMISSDLNLVDDNGRETGQRSLRDAFFDVNFIVEDPDRVGEILNGFITHRAQELDTLVIDDVRNFLFTNIGASGLDLPALNVQRGRDYGLPTYNAAREAYGLGPVSSFDLVTSDTNLRANLTQVYGTPDNMDLWIGCLAEDHISGASVGRLLAEMMREQFLRLMHADRFFFLNDPDFDTSEMRNIIDLRDLRFADIIDRNTQIRPNDRSAFFA